MTPLTKEQREQIVRALRPEDEPRIAPLLEMIEGAGWDNLHPALRPWVTRESPLGPLVRHPFVYGYLGDEGEMVALVNHGYKQKISIRREYLNAKDWHGYLWAHERPWRMVALEKLWDRKRISIEILRELVLDFWTDTECPESNQEIPTKLFRAAGFVTDDAERWSDLPDEITLYRGVDGELELTAEGPSWTLSLDVARFFGYRYGAKGTVYRYTANKSEALAFITARAEEEVILDFAGSSTQELISIEETRAE